MVGATQPREPVSLGRRLVPIARIAVPVPVTLIITLLLKPKGGPLALGPWSAEEAHRNHGQLRGAMSSLPVPANFRHAGDLAGRSGMCFDKWPVYTRQWLVAGDEETVGVQARELLEGEGFILGEWVTDQPAPGTATAEGHRGRLRGAGGPRRGPGMKGRQATGTHSPPGRGHRDRDGLGTGVLHPAVTPQ
jgi:hypothetical protein